MWLVLQERCNVLGYPFDTIFRLDQTRLRMGLKGYLRLSHLSYNIMPCHNPKKARTQIPLSCNFSSVSIFSSSALLFVQGNIFANLSSICQMGQYQKNLGEICGGIYFMTKL